MAREVQDYEETRAQEGFWTWFLQRLTGLLLVFFLAVHIWMGHFAGIGDVKAGREEELVLFDIVSTRLKQAFFIFVDFGLLGLALYHGLNGMRGILLEWRPTRERQQLMTAGLVILGVVAFGFGARVLLVFIL